MEIRFFAGAAEAAGTPSRTVEVTPEQTVEYVVQQVVGDDARLAKVVGASSLLLDGARVRDRSVAVGSATQLDVLPPFAGG
ncbi:MoaD/ThiS family protein [Tessaracoccus rhinocerotis]|uniref:MoaD/ThiS family protein n=1 Tax=Tessaracoccus rhinocerotis TaxID=1689449 RepID=A0A553JWS9_9ACTN|nr:MoaD/ThiS family protein [Tessaracoccus rhinocerotis]TRY16902.1 MoaD/ThiS family protein [Tessaracoccus rhinocerotis]